MIVVGLTGGIGSGKSTVSAALAELGAVVIDADATARELQEPGQPVFNRKARMRMRRPLSLTRATYGCGDP